MRTFRCWAVACAAVFALVLTFPLAARGACVPAGTPGDDTITCTGIDTAGVRGGGGNDQITVDSSANVSKTTSVTGGATATAAATTIDAGEGNNQVVNSGRIAADASAQANSTGGAAAQATAAAGGIRAGAGVDLVSNFWMLEAAAAAGASSTDVSIVADGSASKATTTSVGTSTAIEGGAGADVISSTSSTKASSTATTTATNVTISAAVPGSLDATISSTAQSTGIAAGGGADTIIVGGSLEANANATTGVTDVAVTLGELARSTGATAGATSTATAVGISGGDGGDLITTTGTVKAISSANSSVTGVLVTSLGIGTVATPNTASATSTGVQGNGGADTIINSGQVSADATSGAVSTRVSVSLVQYEAASDGNAKTAAIATATGIAAGDGNDSVSNLSAINATAKAAASTNDISAEYTGAARGNSSTTATAIALGIDGGAGADTITSAVTLQAAATAGVSSWSVDAKRNDIPLDPLEWFGRDLGDSRTESTATATGVSAGSGDDTITNTGTITVSAGANASTDDIVAEVSIGTGGEKPKSSSVGVPFSAVSTGAALLGAAAAETQAAPSNSTTATDTALVNAGTAAVANASGMAGDGGNDALNNYNVLGVTATSGASSLSVGATLSYERSEALDTIGLISLGETTTVARATAVGMDGGSGNDTITNTGTLTATASANADTTSVKAHVQADFTAEMGSWTEFEAGVALVRSGTDAAATGIGMAGGEGDDTILNTGTVTATAAPNAASNSVSVTLTAAKAGLVAGASYADTATAATATAVGIDGGAGKDVLTNIGTIEATATPMSSSVSVGLTATGVTKGKGLEAAVALTDGTTNATGTATGMAGGDGDDTVNNTGTITVKALPDSDSASVSLGVAVTTGDKGLVAGATYANAATTATATAVGMDGGAGNDVLTNTGSLDVTATPTSSSASVGVTISAAVTQEWNAALAGAVTNGTTTATGTAIGIAGGAGDDTISAAGTIAVKADPDADSASVSATLAGVSDGLTVGFTYADGTTSAAAHATAIDGGAGNDTITHSAVTTVTALPTASSATVGATITGATKGTGISGGAALTDATTKAAGEATGIAGGDGDDQIVNSGKIIVKALPDADAASVSLTVGAALGEIGLVGGFSYADGTTTATATAIGIDGGARKDAITNSGTLDVTAEPTSSSASVSLTAVGVKGTGAALGITVVDGTTTATGTAVGIRGGDGDDTITNSGTITVAARPDANSASVGVNIAAAKTGAAVGGSFADATTTAQAAATGIDGEASNDTIRHTGGKIDVTAAATSSSAKVIASAQGVFQAGAAIGAALTEGTTKAIADATGIAGGAGDDTIGSAAVIEAKSTAEIADASVTVNLGYANTGLAAGVAAADGTTTASSTTTGIAGGAGNDVIDNAGSLLSNAHSTVKSASVSVHAGVAVEGVAAGVALADAKTVATSTAYGIAAGDGADTITNRNTITTDARSDVTAASVSVDLEGTEVGLAAGAALSKGETTADALAIGIGGGGGDDSIANAGSVSAHATVDSTRTNVSVKGGFSLYGMAIGASIADGSNTAIADARAVEGGSGNDTLVNSSRLEAFGKTTATTTTVAVDVELAAFGAFSASVATSSTTATARAAGMSGGEGNDWIENAADGAIVVGHQPTTPASSTAPLPTFDDRDATAKAKSVSVSIAQGSFSQAKATTAAEADSRGIDGGRGKDTVINTGSISTYASATTDGQAGTGNLFGYGAADISLAGRAKATGIDGGAGDDIIINRNTGTIVANGDSTTTGRSVTVNLAGGLFAKAGATAETTVVGLQGNAGDDQILNQGTITLGGKTHADVSAVAANLFGYSSGNATNTASAIATGLEGGDGADIVINDTTGSIVVNTSAHGETAAVTVNLAGAGKAAAGSTASAMAVGLSGGAGSDAVQNAGTVTLSAKASTDASSTPVTILGSGDADARATTTATAVGISGGEDSNTLLNAATGVLTATAEATGHASAYSITVAGGTTTHAETVASASATGIAGGSVADGITNDGRISATATSTMTAVSVDVKGVGGGVAHADSSAEATAVGIDGGAGGNNIRNNKTGSITVSSSATAGAGTGTTVALGVSGATASNGSAANATGIVGGSGQDDIANAGTIYVTATSKTRTEQVSLDLASLSIATAKTMATAEGINGGGGNDLLVNTGTITVAGQDRANPVPMAFSDAVGGSFDLWDISISVFGAEAKATGILGGVGDDTIVNQGTMTVGDDHPMAKGKAIGVSGSFISFFSLTGIETRATATAIGIDGGDGNDAIWNDAGARLAVKATATAWTEGNADATFGEKHGAAGATAEATATGLSGGVGNDTIINKGTIAVSAGSEANPTAVAQAGWGKPVADAEANATATAHGVDGGSGNNLLENHGTITVSAAASAYSWAYAEEDAGALADEDAKSRAFAVARAYGIVGGAGQDVVLHTGLMSVTATAIATADAWTEDRDIETPRADATAVAVGIQTGGGNDVVETGSASKLTVQAWTMKSQNGVDVAGATAQAIGIDTGDGDDLVIHGGSILTSINGVQGAGVGISTGAGKDAVTLQNGSSVAGSIDLGAGDDTLILEGTPTVTGAVTGAAGTDTIIFSGAGSAAFTPTAFEQAVKDGAGTFTVAGLPTMQRLELRRGTLHLNSAYQFSPTGLLQATVYGDGSHGQLSVTGAASLDGGLQVQRGRGLYRNGTRYDIVTADTVTGWFKDITLPQPTPLVSFRVGSPRDHVEIEAVVQRVTTVATNPTYQRIAQHLDRIMPDASGDLADVLGEFQALPAGGFDRAFASLGPMAYDSTTRATVGSVGQYTQTLQRRLEAVRAFGQTAGGAAPAGPALLAAAEAEPSLIPILGTYRLSQAQAKNGLWATGFGQWADQETTPGFTGFTASTGGVTAGYDYTFGDYLTTGLSVGYADTDVTLAANQGGGRVQGMYPSLYASYFTKTAYVDGVLSYGHNWYRNDRQLVIGGIQRTATSEHQGNAFAAYLGAGYAYPLGDWAVGPVAALQYVYLKEEGFQETGAGGLNLTVASRGTNSLVSELGVRVAGTVTLPAGTLIPDLSLLWRYDFDLDDRVLTSTYAGAPGAAFSIPGQPAAQHGLLVRPGLTFVHPAGWSTTLRYAGEFRDGYQAQAVLGEVRVQF